MHLEERRIQIQIQWRCDQLLRQLEALDRGQCHQQFHHKIIDLHIRIQVTNNSRLIRLHSNNDLRWYRTHNQPVIFMKRGMCSTVQWTLFTIFHFIEIFHKLITILILSIYRNIQGNYPTPPSPHKYPPPPPQASGPNTMPPQGMPPYGSQSQQFPQGNYPTRPQYPSNYGQGMLDLHNAHPTKLKIESNFHILFFIS